MKTLAYSLLLFASIHFVYNLPTDIQDEEFFAKFQQFLDETDEDDGQLTDRPEFYANEDPEAHMRVDEIIRYHGYPVENHTVQTADGYILTIHRIPYGRSGRGTKPRKPVLIQHGLFCTSAIWVCNTADKNLPYLVADAGFDVWLGNIRGTIYGDKHVNLTTKDKAFWKYSFDEVAKYDIPAVIDMMLEKTGYEQIIYIGHSMGTTVSFSLLSTQPKYNKIIRAALELAPVARLDYVRSPIKLLAPFSKHIKFLVEAFQLGDYMPTPANQKLIKFLGSTLCVSPVKAICQNIIFIGVGFNLPELNTTRAPVYLAHTPATTSTQNLLHIAQVVHYKKYLWHDFGSIAENIQHYGQAIPPEYDMKKITTKVALFYGDNDLLADKKDVAWLATQLPNLVLKYRVPLDKFSHMDFALAIHVRELLYDKVIETLHKLWRDDE